MRGDHQSKFVYASSIPWRQIAIEQLEMLSSEAEQLVYEQNVPLVDNGGTAVRLVR